MSTKDVFDQEYDLKEGYDYEFGIIMTSYYPVVGMTVISILQDTLIVYSDVQGDLILPWTIRGRQEKTFNPEINRALYSILPEELNYNRGRLVRGLK